MNKSIGWRNPGSGVHQCYTLRVTTPKKTKVGLIESSEKANSKDSRNSRIQFAGSSLHFD
jgi:hypothetical protein